MLPFQVRGALSVGEPRELELPDGGKPEPKRSGSPRATRSRDARRMAARPRGLVGRAAMDPVVGAGLAPALGADRDRPRLPDRLLAGPVARRLARDAGPSGSSSPRRSSSRFGPSRACASRAPERPLDRLDRDAGLRHGPGARSTTPWRSVRTIREPAPFGICIAGAPRRPSTSCASRPAPAHAEARPLRAPRGRAARRGGIGLRGRARRSAPGSPPRSIGAIREPPGRPSGSTAGSIRLSTPARRR